MNTQIIYNLHSRSKSVSTRDEDDYISMDEVDNLQPELESILSSMSKRVKALQAEIQNLSSSLERGKDKLGSSPSGTLTPQSTGSMVMKWIMWRNENLMCQLFMTCILLNCFVVLLINNITNN